MSRGQFPALAFLRPEEEQAFEQARQSFAMQHQGAGITRSDAIRYGLSRFCAGQGVSWPQRQTGAAKDG